MSTSTSHGSSATHPPQSPDGPAGPSPDALVGALEPPRGAGARLRWAVLDGWTMTKRNVTHVIRGPEEIAIYFTLPILFVMVFGYVFGSGMAMPDGENYREFLMPGVFVMTMLYGMAATATSVASDSRKGVVDRFRSMPVADSALLTGRSTADLFRALLEITVLVVCGLLVGWGWHNGTADAAIAVGLLLLLRVAMTWMGILLGMLIPNPDTVGVIVFPLAFPLTAVSNVFVPPEAMPGWLGAVAEWNPLSATTAALRDLFGNPGLGSDSWAAEHALLLSVLSPLLIIAVVAPLAVVRYRNLSR